VISAKRNILLIDNHDSFTYNLVQVFEELGCSVEVGSNPKQITSGLDQFDKIVFSPGPGLPEDFPIMFDILRLANKKTRILGICLGHQAICQFFGGHLFNQGKVQHGQKKRIDNICKDPHSALFNMPPAFFAGLYHSWAIDRETLPKMLSISCISEDNVIMGIYHNVLPIEGIQFHPESFLTETGSRLIKNWLQL
jgi:anthranilate synthase/aminodeoxychorismate synthase-like glutamine amidotransferase